MLPQGQAYVVSATRLVRRRASNGAPFRSTDPVGWTGIGCARLRIAMRGAGALVWRHRAGISITHTFEMKAI